MGSNSLTRDRIPGPLHCSHWTTSEDPVQQRRTQCYKSTVLRFLEIDVKHKFLEIGGDYTFLCKDSTCSAGYTGDPGSVLESGRSPGEANGNPLQYSCLENPMDRGAWQGYSPRGCKELDTAEHALRTENSCLYACKFVLLVALQYIFLITPK